jgi:hypothetical protein
MVYGDYLETISAKFQSLFAEISAEYAFDYGDEFEIALCKVLRALLPSKFGICRGFAVTLDGTLAGDDIIIFDHERFPTLRLLESNDFAQKRIPSRRNIRLCWMGMAGKASRKRARRLKRSSRCEGNPSLSTI